MNKYQYKYLKYKDLYNNLKGGSDIERNVVDQWKRHTLDKQYNRLIPEKTNCNVINNNQDTFNILKEYIIKTGSESVSKGMNRTTFFRSDAFTKDSSLDEAFHTRTQNEKDIIHLILPPQIWKECILNQLNYYLKLLSKDSTYLRGYTFNNPRIGDFGEIKKEFYYKLLSSRKNIIKKWLTNDLNLTCTINLHYNDGLTEIALSEAFHIDPSLRFVYNFPEPEPQPHEGHSNIPDISGTTDYLEDSVLKDLNKGTPDESDERLWGNSDSDKNLFINQFKQKDFQTKKKNNEWIFHYPTLFYTKDNENYHVRYGVWHKKDIDRANKSYQQQGRIIPRIFVQIDFHIQPFKFKFPNTYPEMVISKTALGL